MCGDREEMSNGEMQEMEGTQAGYGGVERESTYIADPRRRSGSVSGGEREQ